MIFIAYNYKNQPISIVNAKSKELAEAFWQGRNLNVDHVKNLEKDFIDLDSHPTGVFPLFETEVMILGFDKEYLIVKK